MPQIRKYLHTIDAAGNKVIHFILDPISTGDRITLGGTLGLSDEGYTVFDTTLDRQYFWDGTSWISSSVVETDPFFNAWLLGPPNISEFTNDVGYLTTFTETDPIFTAWLAGPPNVSEFNNDAGYITSWGPETDPVYTASSWFSTTNNSANWNTAFGWGNHAGLYDMSGAAAAAITAHNLAFNHSNIANGQTAFTWGNHALAGYLTSETDPIYIASSWFGTTNNSTNWNTAYTDRNKWDGGAIGLTAATGRTSLGGTTIGQNIFISTNPSAITFGRANADNSFDWLDAATFRTAIGAGTGSGTITGTGTINELAYWTSSSALGALPVATYPSLTELSYVKGVTSAIQTQLNSKQATISLGTGVLTALGVNIGSAGAPVLFGGALGTPSSGVLTNATGLPLTSGLTGGTWKTIYTDGSGVVTELALGAAGKVLTTNGAASAPTWETPTGGANNPLMVQIFS